MRALLSASDGVVWFLPAKGSVVFIDSVTRDTLLKCPADFSKTHLGDVGFCFCVGVNSVL